jgi:hypothetical protein
MDAVNRIRARPGKKRPRELRKPGIVDADGTTTPTDGEKKPGRARHRPTLVWPFGPGMGPNYRGIWGRHPPPVSLANAKEPLFMVDRAGNRVGHDDAAMWIDRAVKLTRQAFDEVLVRGDTDFSPTVDFDRRTDDGVKFVFGHDARRDLVETADSPPNSAWRPLVRKCRAVKTRERRRRENTKDEIVREKGYENIRPGSEEIGEFAYRPAKCEETCRMIVVRKDLARERGEIALFDETRHFFRVTNDFHVTAEDVVGHANARRDQENLIERLKNGVNALRAPAHDLVSSCRARRRPTHVRRLTPPGACMVVASLAWGLKAWMGLVQPREADRDDLLRMEFKRFLNCVMRIPCQIVRTAPRVLARVLGYTSRVRLLFETVAAARRLCRSGVT